MTIETGDVVRFVTSLLMPQAVIAQGVFHYLYAGTGDTEDAVGEALKARMTSMYDTMEDEVSTEVSSSEVSALVWDNPLQEWHGFFNDAWADFVGLGVTHMLPHGAAALCRLLTDVPKRQGRKFIPGLTEGFSDDGVWTAQTLVDMALFVSNAVAVTNVANGTLSPGTFNEVENDFKAFENAGVVNAFTSYQRRRRPGVGI